MSHGPLLTKSFEFALLSIGLYKQLIKSKEFILSKQFLRSATSIGANVEEAQGGLSKSDFSAKMAIAYKEGRETGYWLKLLHQSKYIDDTSFEKYSQKLLEVNRMLFAVLRTTGRIRGGSE